MINAINTLPINANGKNARTSSTDISGFIGSYLRPDSACVLHQNQNHLAKARDSVREEADIVCVAEVSEDLLPGKST